MKLHKLIRHLLITIGITLGVITTGTAVSAKAQQINPNNTTNNNKLNNQELNNNQINQSSNVLVNVPNNNDNYSNPQYHQAHQAYDQESQINNRNNKINSNEANRKANDIYQNILLNITRESHHLRNLSNTINNRSKHSKHHRSKNNLRANYRKIRLGQTFRRAHKSHLRPLYNRNNHINRHRRHNWFRDNLSRRNLRARSWVSWHESNHRWRVLSYGGVCVGYFQLSPSYLGYRHGHVNLNKRHQVKVADLYVRHRYGNWVNAKRFWEIHHWY